MCRRRAGALAVGWLLMGAGAGAQAQDERPAVERRQILLARAESLARAAAAQESAEVRRQSEERRARPFEAGPLAVVLPGTVSAAEGERIARAARAYLDELGAVPRSFVASVVVVAYGGTDTARVLGESRYRARTRTMADVGFHPDSSVAGWQVARAVAALYRESLDADWREFLPADYGVGWELARDGPAALRTLTDVTMAAGAGCLAAKVAECRRWLGLDRVGDPFTVRYRPLELRVIVARLYYAPRDSLWRACLDRSDDGCLAFARARRELGAVATIPAPDAARGSVIRAVRALHGAAAVARALADTAGSVGERLARASGIGVDSLAAEWRYWVLTRGGRSRVAAGFREALPVMVLAGVLLVAAARSGRWR